MKVIKVQVWKATNPEGKEVEETTINMLESLLSVARPEEMPRGLEQYKLFARISKAIDEAGKTKILRLEDNDYEFMKGIIEKNIPAVWATNKNLSQAVESILEAKEGK